MPEPEKIYDKLQAIKGIDLKEFFTKDISELSGDDFKKAVESLGLSIFKKASESGISMAVRMTSPATTKNKRIITDIRYTSLKVMCYRTRKKNSPKFIPPSPEHPGPLTNGAFSSLWQPPPASSACKMHRLYPRPFQLEAWR